MYKKYCLCLFLFFSSALCFSQTIKGKLDQLHKEPATAERAARADVYRQKNKPALNSSTNDSHTDLVEKKKRRKHSKSKRTR